MVLDNYIKYIYGSTVRDTGDSGVREEMKPHLKSLTGEKNYIYPGSRETFVNFAACRNLIFVLPLVQMIQHQPRAIMRLRMK